MKLIIAGGGTGGHISPAIAVAQALWELEPEVSVEFIATPRPVDTKMYSEFGDAVHVLDPPRLDRGLKDLMLLPSRALRGYLSASRLLKELEPDGLLSTGGYSSFFPVVSAWRLGIPSMIHESNSIPGKANRLAARFCDRVLTGFQSASSGFGCRVTLSGNPVRFSLERMDTAKARDILGIPPDRFTVLFLGGSQGARAVNDLALAVPEGFHAIVQTGGSDFERVRELAGGSDRITALDFADDPSALYSAADLAVARSGAMTTAEMSWFRVPAIYIPYPFAADDHQRWNAEDIAEKGGAIRIDQDKVTPGSLWETAGKLSVSEDGLSEMRKALSAAMPENPAIAIAEMFLEMAGGKL